MLPFIHGKIWYWGRSYEYSKWYPSVKILRSQDLNSWGTLIQDLQENLKENDD
jgi:beta-xylosidase